MYSKWRQFHQCTYCLHYCLWYISNFLVKIDHTVKICVLSVINFYCYFQVPPPGGYMYHQSQYQMMYWCSAGLLHGLLMGYSCTTQSLWPTPTPVWVTVFTTSNTNITLTKDNITSKNSSSSSSQCDQYVWSVTAVNPAGISVPANYTTTVSYYQVNLLV